MNDTENRDGELNQETASDQSGGEQVSAPAEADLTSQLQAEVEKLKTEQLYLRAEFDNYRKQAIKERSDLIKFGSERLLLDVIGVLDNFERAVQSAEQSDFDTYKKGVELTANELKSILTRFGVQEVPSEHKPFDPNWHEALSSEEREDIPPGHISTVFKKAYKLHDRVLRPGQVVVAKSKS